MNEMIDISETINNSKQLEVGLNLSNPISNLSKGITDSTLKCIGSAAKYVIKMLPIAEGAKDVLNDIKEAIVKRKDFKSILSVAVKSSIREGLEIIGVSGENVASLMKLGEVAKKGGLGLAVKNALQIVAKNYLKNRLVGDYVYSFFERLYQTVQSSSFMVKLQNMLKKLDDKKNVVLQKIKEWYNAYDKGDGQIMNTLASEISKSEKTNRYYADCMQESNIIKNITKSFLETHNKIPVEQLQLSKSL